VKRPIGRNSRGASAPLKDGRDPPFGSFMRSIVRHGSVAVGFLLAAAVAACTPGGAAGGLADEYYVGGKPMGPPFGPSASASEPAPGAGVGTHRYQITASVGDFLQIAIDKDSHTATYVNRTNGLEGAGVPYTVEAKGAYVFADPNGHLKSAVELEDYALVVDVDKAGPHKDSRALAVGTATLPIAITDFADRRLNMMQFRITNGGMEVGSVDLATSGNGLTIDLQSYWPRGAMADNDHPFHVGKARTMPVQESPGLHDFLTLAETQGMVTSLDYVFKTATGFAIDMAGGNIVMLEQPESKDFDAASAGSYRALAYGKRGAKSSAEGEPEPGEPTVEAIDLTVDGAGHVVAVDSHGVTTIDDDLTPVPDVAYLAGAGKLDPSRCKGIFTFRRHGAAGNREVFVIFTKDGLLFSSFAPTLAEPGGDAPYDYVYGAAVKQR
jgi:hypothetical protein